MEQTINIEELVQDDHNLNKGTREGQRLMERSFKALQGDIKAIEYINRAKLISAQQKKKK